MSLEYILNNLKRELIRTFAVADGWFDKELSLCNHKPGDESWTIYEVLEHIMLTNHFLLIIIDKGTAKALGKRNEMSGSDFSVPSNYVLGHPELLAIADPEAFAWQRPEHHQPEGLRSIHEIRREIRDQLNRCLISLELLPNGEGLLHRTTMSVNNIGKLDVYQYVYFLALHIQRHLRQMEKVEESFRLQRV